VQLLSTAELENPQLQGALFLPHLRAKDNRLLLMSLKDPSNDAESDNHTRETPSAGGYYDCTHGRLVGSYPDPLPSFVCRMPHDCVVVLDTRKIKTVRRRHLVAFDVEERGNVFRLEDPLELRRVHVLSPDCPKGSNHQSHLQTAAAQQVDRSAAMLLEFETSRSTLILLTTREARTIVQII